MKEMINQFISAHYDELWKYARTILPRNHKDQAGDLVSHVLIPVYKMESNRVNVLINDQKLKGYLFMVMRCEIRKGHTFHDKYLVPVSEITGPTRESIATLDQPFEFTEHLFGSTFDKDMAILHFVEAYPMQEISEMTGITYRNVWASIQRTKQKIEEYAS
jgi:hypothetical protein